MFPNCTLRESNRLLPRSSDILFSLLISAGTVKRCTKSSCLTSLEKAIRKTNYILLVCSMLSTMDITSNQRSSTPIT